MCNALRMSLEKTSHTDNVSLLREQLQSLQTRLSTLQGWRMKELSDEQVESIAEEVRDAMRMLPPSHATPAGSSSALTSCVCLPLTSCVCLPQVRFETNRAAENRRQPRWPTAHIAASCALDAPPARAWCDAITLALVVVNVL